jgi:V8-like Glu-specific endopeptidase
MLKAYPYQCIGLVLVNRTNRPSYTSTGFLISPDLVATAAHNLKDENGELSKPSTIEFYPALKGKRVNPLQVADYRIPEEYRTITLKKTQSTSN